MIDTVPGRFVDFRHFVVAAFGANHRGRGLVPILVLVLASGCTPRSAPSTVEDSPTSGRIRIVCAPETRTLIGREAEAFKSLYPEASLEVRTLPSRLAVAALFADEADVAVTTRELTPEERGAAVRGGLELEGYQFARDALVLIANPGNGVENVALDEIREVFGGRVTSWSRLGGEDRPIETVVQPGAADLSESLSELVLGGEPVRSPSRAARDEAEAVRLVGIHRDALGYVSLAAATDAVRPLRVASLTGLPYWKPDLEVIHRGEYPLTRMFSMYLRADGPRLAGGFVTFATSREGQKLVQEHGLVPTAVPVRFVRRSPMLGGH